MTATSAVDTAARPARRAVASGHGHGQGDSILLDQPLPVGRTVASVVTAARPVEVALAPPAWGRRRRMAYTAKGVADRVLALVLLIALAPVLAAAAVLVATTSPGGVLFRQERTGRHGTAFTILKIRTMVADAEVRKAGVADRNDGDGLLFKVQDDPRMTRGGRFLRRLSIDELPQLWNVVRGDMSLVGPRPLPVPADTFSATEARRHDVRPGLTGLWQVSGRSGLSWGEAIRLDLAYVEEWSLGLDLRILARTPVAVLRATGAY